MLLRLRQLTAHILMLQKVVCDLLEREDIEKIREVVQREATSQEGRKARTIVAIRKQLDQLEKDAKTQSANKATNRSRQANRWSARGNGGNSEERDFEELLNDDEDEVMIGQPSRSGAGRSFGKNFDFRPYLNSLTTGENWRRVKARAGCCGDSSHTLNEGAWVTSCGHILCTGCYEEVTLQAAEDFREHGICKGCTTIFTHATELPKDGEDVGTSRRTTRAKMTHSRKAQQIEQEDIAEDWLTWGGEGVLPSAKTIALKAQLLNWYVCFCVSCDCC